MIHNNNLKQWINSNLEQKSMNLKDLSKKTGLSRAIIYLYFKDSNRPTYKSMEKICNVFDVPIAEGLSQYVPNKVGRPLKKIQEV